MKFLLTLFATVAILFALGVRGGYIDRSELHRDVSRGIDELYAKAEELANETQPRLRASSPPASSTGDSQPRSGHYRSHPGSGRKDFSSRVEGSRPSSSGHRSEGRSTGFGGDAREFAGASADLVKEGWNLQNRPARETVERFHNDPGSVRDLERKVERAFDASERMERHVESASSAIDSLFSR